MGFFFIGHQTEDKKQHTYSRLDKTKQRTDIHIYYTRTYFMLLGDSSHTLLDIGMYYKVCANLVGNPEIRDP